MQSLPLLPKFQQHIGNNDERKRNVKRQSSNYTTSKGICHFYSDKWLWMRLKNSEREGANEWGNEWVSDTQKITNRKSCTHSYKLVWHQEIIIIYTRQMKNHFGFKTAFYMKTLRAREKRRASFEYVPNAFWRVHHVRCVRLCVCTICRVS